MNMIAKLILILALSFTSNLAASDDESSRQSELFKAVKVAMDDFEKRLAGDHQDWEYAAYISNIGNYGVGFAESDNFYVVVFQLKATKERIFGGGGKYFVSKQNMKIIKFVGYE